MKQKVLKALSEDMAEKILVTTNMVNESMHDNRKSLNLTINPTNKKGKGLKTEYIWGEILIKSSWKIRISNVE